MGIGDIIFGKKQITNSEEETFVNDLKSLLSVCSSIKSANEENIVTVYKRLGLVIENFEKTDDLIERVTTIMPLLLKFKYISKVQFENFLKKNNGEYDKGVFNKIKGELIKYKRSLENPEYTNVYKINIIKNKLVQSLKDLIVFLNFLIEVDKKLKLVGEIPLN